MKNYIFIFLFTFIGLYAQVDCLYADCPNTRVKCELNPPEHGNAGYLFGGELVASFYEHGICHPLHYGQNALDDMCSAQYSACFGGTCTATWKEE